MIFEIRGKLFVLWGREWTRIHDNPLVYNHLGLLSLLSSCMRPCVLTPDGYPRPWGSPVLSLVSLRSSWSARESTSRHLGSISAHMSHMVSQGGMVIFNKPDIWLWLMYCLIDLSCLHPETRVQCLNTEAVGDQGSQWEGGAIMIPPVRAWCSSRSDKSHDTSHFLWSEYWVPI